MLTLLSVRFTSLSYTGPDHLAFQYCTAGEHFNATLCSEARNATMMKSCDDGATTDVIERCEYIFDQMGLNDTTTGLILLVLSLLMLCTCLTILVKSLQSLLIGRMAQTLKKHINSDLPRPFGWLTG